MVLNRHFENAQGLALLGGEVGLNETSVRALSLSGWGLDLGSARALRGVAGRPQTLSEWAPSEPSFIPPHTPPGSRETAPQGWEPPSQVETLGSSL